MDTHLACPFDEKDDVKALGAKFSWETKTWYVSAGTDVAPFTKWLPNGVKWLCNGNDLESRYRAQRNLPLVKGTHASVAWAQHKHQIGQEDKDNKGRAEWNKGYTAERMAEAEQAGKHLEWAAWQQRFEY